MSSAPEIGAAFQAPHRVTAIERVTPAVVELWLAPLGEPVDHLPGQYVLLEDAAGRVAPRSYSIANAPRTDGRISLLVSRVDGGQASTWVHERVRAGDTVAVSGPYGTFVDDAAATAPALHLTGGSGLAPSRALLEAALVTRRRPALRLVFSARTRADVIDAERFARWQRDHPCFRFIRTLTRSRVDPPPLGRIPTILAGLVGGLDDHDVFIAGAPGFVRDCAAAAEALGAPRACVHTEPFFVEPQPWTGPPPEAAR